MSSLEEGHLRTLGRGCRLSEAAVSPWGGPGQLRMRVQAESGPAGCTTPPFTGGESEAQLSFAHCWGQRVCRGTSKLPRTPANQGVPGLCPDAEVPQPTHRALLVWGTRGMCVCSVVGSGGWYRALAVEPQLRSHPGGLSAQLLGWEQRSAVEDRAEARCAWPYGWTVHPALWGDIRWSPTRRHGAWKLGPPSCGCMSLSHGCPRKLVSVGEGST